VGKNSSKKFFLTILIIVVCFISISGVKSFKGHPLFASSAQMPHSKGSPHAPVKIIEYMDFQCPACANGAHLLENFIKNNPDKFYLEVRYYPLEMHFHAMRAARYAECAGRQGKFWVMHDLLFKQQSTWAPLLNAEGVFGEMTKTIRLDPKKLEQCLADPTINNRILKDKEKGKAQEVKSTPTYFINNKMVVGTANLEKELKSSLESLPNAVHPNPQKS